MHSKLQLLAHELVIPNFSPGSVLRIATHKSLKQTILTAQFSTHLRIVVPSANLVPYDWGETGVMENVSFLNLSELWSTDLVFRWSS